MTIAVNRFRGVLFDLFGTVVVPFSMTRHQEALAQVAAIAGLEADRCNAAWRDDYENRVRGRSGAIGDQLLAMAAAAGTSIAAEPLARAAAVYRDYCVTMMEPLPTAWETLAALAGKGVPLGLVSNTAPDFAAAFERSDLRRFFASCTFSCDLGHAKPEREVYLAGAATLELPLDQLLFVGDGSDDELAGAARAGLTPALVEADTTDTYDAERGTMPDWAGIRFPDLTGTLAFA